MAFTLNANSLGSTLNLQQTLNSLNDNYQQGNVLGVIADTAAVAATVATYELQVGASITSTGLSMAQAMDKLNKGTLEPKDMMAVSNAILGGLAALGVVMAAPEAAAGAATVALVVGAYSYLTGSDKANEIMKWISSDQFKNDLSKGFISFGFAFGDAINGLERIIADLNNKFIASQHFRRDPLVLDLNGNGLETVGINTANPILFDHNGDGVKTATGWVAPSDGLLVWDRNGNGVIDDGRELFGDATIKSNGQVAKDGFDALTDLDSNHDGKVDSNDTNFANLRVWQDLNQDGITQSGELTTLAAQNITSFNVARTSNSITLANGNQVADLGSYTRSNGGIATLGAVTGNLGDVNLASNPFYSQFTDTIPLTAEAQALPDMRGTGMVRCLQEAASLSPILAATLTQFSAGSYDVQKASLDTLLLQWSATSTFATTTGGAYGARPLTIILEGIVTGTTAYTAFLEKLSLLERFNGQTFRTVPADPTAPVTISILSDQQNLIDQSYQALKRSVYGSLVMQTRLKPYLDSVTLNLTASGISTDTSGINVALDNLKTTDFKGALCDLIDLYRINGLQLNSMGWTGANKLTTWVDQAALDPAMRPVLQSFATTTEWADVLIGLAGNDVLNASGGDDVLMGGDGTDSLDGGAGNDVLDGGAGNDTLSGGAGNDVYFFGRGQGGDVINNAKALASEVDVIRLKDDILPDAVTLYRHGDDLVLVIDGSSTQIWAKNSFNASGMLKIDQIQFANGTVWSTDDMASRTLSGSINSMTGTAGDDVFNVDNLLDTISEGANQGTDTVQSWVQYTLGANIENLTLTGALNINGTGNALDNVICGNSGNNVLDGGGMTRGWADDGTDTLIGGAGDDTYYVTPATGDVVVEQANEGIDTVIANFGYTLPDNVENLIIHSNWQYPITATGNALDNVITGQSTTVAYIDQYGRFIGDTIDGGAGADIMTLAHGGTFYVDNVGDRINASGLLNVFSSIDYALPEYAGGYYPAVSNLTLIGAGDINGTGNGGNNTIADNGGNNILTGGAGDDRLIVCGGNDTLIGGLGNDTYSIGGNEWGGQDVIYNTASDAVSAVDTLEIGGGAALFQRNGDDLVISTGLNASVTVTNHFAADGLSQIDQVRFMNTGTVWNAAQIEQNLYVQPQGTNSADVLAGIWTSDTIHGYAGDDTISGGEGADHLYGDSGNDTLNGENGNDVLAGGTGNDLLNGGYGNDVYLFSRGDGMDIISDFDDTVGNQDTLRFDSTIAVPDIHVSRVWQNLLLDVAGSTDQIQIDSWLNGDTNKIERIEFADGTVWGVADILSKMSVTPATGGDDIIYGLDTNDVIHGLSGNDMLVGMDGDDTLYGDEGDDDLQGCAGNDTLVGGAGNDYYEFYLGDGQDQIDNAASDNATSVDTLRISGVAASAVLLSRTGDDLFVKVSATDNITIKSYYAAGADNKIDQIEFDDGTVWDRANIELHVGMPTTGDDVLGGTSGNDTIHALAGNDTVSGGAGDDQLYGDAGNDTLNGDDGNDLLDGGAGTDKLFGGLGNDTYVVDSTADVVTELANAGTDTVQSAVTFTLGANVENLTLTGTTAIKGTGNTLNNVLDGSLNTAANVLTGGTGNDTYILGTGDTIVEAASAGTDTVMSSATYTLGTNLENLTLTGTAAINGTGNTVANVLTGNGAANTLSGGTGADTMIGGAGNDTYVVDNVGDIVTELLNEGTDLVQSSVTYTLSANVENLTLTGTTAINGTGNAGDNVLTGNSAVNTLTGGAGNDTLNGGTGADKLLGGLGNDTYVVDNTGDVITENLNEGVDLVQSSVTYTLAANVENLTLTGTTAINGTGNALDNVLDGSVNTKANVLTGGAGNDTYVLGTGDTIVEAAAAGTDTVMSAATYTLGTNLENLVLTGTTAINGTGNTLNNLLVGNAANNTLSDGAGNDILQGGLGNDILTDTAGANLFDGGAGTDTLTGSTGNEFFVGGAGNDTIVTGTGADILAFNRGDGADVVNGGIGTDNTISLGKGINYSDLALSKVNNDLILEVGTGDQITLSNWYNTAANYKSVVDLQVMADAMAAFNSASSDPLLSKAVQNFNFTAIVNAFDQANGGNATFMHWSATNTPLAAHLSGSDTAALGGDLAHQFGTNGSLTGMNLAAAQTVINDAQFGGTPQTLHAFQGLQGGAVTL